MLRDDEQEFERLLKRRDEVFRLKGYYLTYDDSPLFRSTIAMGIIFDSLRFISVPPTLMQLEAGVQHPRKQTPSLC
jgi:hypothetical protein